MEGFTLIDGVVAVVILLSAILAYSRGLVREVMAIAGWIAAAVLAFLFAAQAEPLIKQLPVLDKYLGQSCELSMIAAFAAVFAGALILASIFTPLFASAVQRSALGGVDQGLGFLFGALRGIVLVAVAFVVYDRVMTGSSLPVVDESRSVQIFAAMEDKLNAEMPTDLPGWITARYEDLVGACATAAADAPTADPTGAKTLTAPAASN